MINFITYIFIAIMCILGLYAFIRSIVSLFGRNSTDYEGRPDNQDIDVN